MTLERLRGGLIVSVQAAAGTALDDPAVIAAMAEAAVEGGAAGVRIQGVENLRAVRSRVTVPIVGIIKRAYEGFDPYITPTLREAQEVLACDAEIVAFDATAREHPQHATIATLVDAIHRAGALAMANCALASDGLAAHAAGADIIATTLCGYTSQTRGASLPALDILRAWQDTAAFRVCEGGVHSPDAAAQAMASGAHAVVVGTAITNISWATAAYAKAVGKRLLE